MRWNAGRVARRTFVLSGGALGVAGAGGVLAACGGAASPNGNALQTKERITLTWWAGSGRDPGFIAIKDAFMQRFPNVTVQYEKEADHLKPEGLAAAVLAGMSPDATRFADVGLGNWASNGGVLVLDDRLKRSQFFKKDDFYSRQLESGKWAGKLYAIPFLTDTRPLFWNADVLRIEGYPPDKGPADWDALREYTVRMTRRQSTGYERVGFIPLFGNSWLYLFGWLNGAEPVQFSQDGTKVRCILNDAKWVQALDFMNGLYTAIGGKDAMDNWLKEANGTGSQQALLAGRVAMMIFTDTFGATIGKDAPTLNFGFSLPPAPKGKAALTWSGIWNMVVMKDAKRPDEAAEFISWVTAVDGVKAWAEGMLSSFRATGSTGYWYPNVSTNRRAGEAAFEVAKGQMPEPGQRLRKFSQDALQTSRSRPVMPAGLEVWDAQAAAQTAAFSGKQTPKAALDEQTQMVNARFADLGIGF